MIIIKLRFSDQIKFPSIDLLGRLKSNMRITSYCIIYNAATYQWTLYIIYEHTD